MVRSFFGRHNRQATQQQQSRDETTSKKRLSPSVVDWTDDTLDKPVSARRTRIGIDSPMYRYAMEEYAQAVAPGTSNDDGRMMPPEYSHSTPRARISKLGMDPMTPGALHSVSPSAPSALFGARISSREDNEIAAVNDGNETVDRRDSAVGLHEYPNLHARSTLPNPDTSSYHTNARDYEKSSAQRWSSMDMPDATYEEIYGEAYVGGTIKYVYPSGYQSMRPRSCPWKLSIVVCLLFTWLSIFIVGHCSDQANELTESNAAAASDASTTYDDDEIRWCGSRPLYLLWVSSMLVTGISAAYCSVIGYIKVRDFAVANARSQPPGVAQGSSDYYVRIHDDQLPGALERSASDVASSVYRPTIYQSDGTPQFWGAHIYRPTQAAVAVTSR